MSTQRKPPENEAGTDHSKFSRPGEQEMLHITPVEQRADKPPAANRLPIETADPDSDEELIGYLPGIIHEQKSEVRPITHGPELSAPLLPENFKFEDARSAWSEKEESRWGATSAIDTDFTPVEPPSISLDQPRSRAARFGLSGDSNISTKELEDIIRDQQIDADYEETPSPADLPEGSLPINPPAFDMPLPGALRSPATEKPPTPDSHQSAPENLTAITVDRDFRPVEEPALEVPPVAPQESAPPKSKRDILPDPNAFSDEEPTQASSIVDQMNIEEARRRRIAAAEKAKHPPLPSTGGWKQKALVGLAAFAGFFGVKIGFEKAEEAAKENIEAASDAFDYFNGDVTAKMAEAGRAPFEQQPSEPLTAEQEPLTHTYIVQSGDSPWGLADSILESAGIDDPDGTLTLKAVKGLREKNNIQGDAARSKNMWVGQTLDLSPVYDLIASVKEPSSTPESHRTAVSSHTGAESAGLSNGTADTVLEVVTQLSPELTSHTLNYPGETIWSRTQNMLESLDVKPNMAKRSVLGAIVLADSHMNETQAMRIKYTDHKKFDATKDTLDFTRAAQAALDLKAGMSPGDVAKKYGVKNQYEKLRDR